MSHLHPRSAEDCLLGDEIHHPHGGCPGIEDPDAPGPWPSENATAGTVDVVVMQPQCVYCKREQPAAAVAAISHGDAGCANCGRIPPLFTTADAYQSALRAPEHLSWSWVTCPSCGHVRTGTHGDVHDGCAPPT